MAKTKNKSKRPLKRKPVVRKSKRANKSRLSAILIFLMILVGGIAITFAVYKQHHKKTDITDFQAQPFNKVRPLAHPSAVASGISPAKIKTAYGLGSSPAGAGTIAIIDAYDNPKAESDLKVFTTKFGLKLCTTANRCFEKHKMRSSIPTSSEWAIESDLDVQWAHAIAQNAKILLVEAKSNSGTDLLAAVDYARSRSDVVAISMSWGGNEFSTEASYESHFNSSFGATFFASSGDSGHGTSWPAVSANVVSVGGTKVDLDSGGHIVSETAWSGSGGGLSNYINEPLTQTTYNVPLAGGKRAVPDVSYNADPASGFPVYDSIPYYGSKGWFIVGGTSAGAPQWAALRSITSNITASRLYEDGHSSPTTFFRDITTGTNGSCGALCTAGTNYDYVTGLGSPKSATF